VAYIRKYLPETPVYIVGYVKRVQGLMVFAGNPLAITDLEVLAGNGVRYVNRQRGAGTRVLLDFELEKAGIDSSQIEGYDQEEYTHLAVAAAIASGRADCGLGIPAAAQALGLDFIPLFSERYDLIVPKAHYNSALFGPLLSLLTAPEFQAAVAALPGYEVPAMGSILGDLE
jgi:putative molybdopterin biosynthesis protein